MRFRVEAVQLAWKDNGHKMWNVLATRVEGGASWLMRTWAIDELDAYKKAMATLEGADQ